MSLVHLKEGLRMLKRAIRVKKTGFWRYRGNPEDICKKIIRDCYDPKEKFFRTSTGNFHQFWTRDFAFVAEHLSELGYEKEVASTFSYALEKFREAQCVSTTITPEGKPFNFPMWGPESLALLLLSLRRTQNAEIVEQHKEFLQKRVSFVANNVMDSSTKLPRRDKKYQSPRDQVTTYGSCYTAVMLAVIAREAEFFGMAFPVKWQEIRDALIEEYWNGAYFFSDIQKQAIVVGDANTYPFWTRIVDDKKMLRKAIDSIKAAKLDAPWPLKYVNSTDKHKEKRNISIASWLTPDYMTDTLWIHTGLCYIEVLSTLSKNSAKRHLKAYTENIQTHRNFLEVYWPDGTPYQTPFYVADEGMLWCASYLNLAQKLKVI